jgi:hypothetical protein
MEDDRVRLGAPDQSHRSFGRMAAKLTKKSVVISVSFSYKKPAEAGFSFGGGGGS